MENNIPSVPIQEPPESMPTRTQEVEPSGAENENINERLAPTSWLQIPNKDKHPKELVIGDLNQGVRTRRSHLHSNF